MHGVKVKEDVDGEKKQGNHQDEKLGADIADQGMEESEDNLLTMDEDSENEDEERNEKS